MSPEQKATLERQIEVMQGALHGKEVEVWDRRHGKWYRKQPGDSFNWYVFTYRIKPEVKTLNVYKDTLTNVVSGYERNTEVELKVAHSGVWKFVKSIDVEV